MGQKVNPVALRLGIIRDWTAKWFNKKRYALFLREDWLIRSIIERKLKNAGVEKIIIERSPNIATIIVRSARPGIIIGRGGAGIEELHKEIKKQIRTPLKLEIQEIRNPDAYATLVAKNAAEQIEKRFAFRRVLGQTVERVIQNKEVLGVKIQLSGRLGGADMSRREWTSRGKLPLQTLRADIDFAKATAHTNYGSIGVKVWIYKK